MDYINVEWKLGHILATDKDFFNYQYRNLDNLNFVLSKNHENRIIGMLGFIKASSVIHSDIWTNMWKVSKVSTDSGNPVLGIQMLEYLRKLGYRTVMSSGINQKQMIGMKNNKLRNITLGME
jgi:hypothetical protein